MATVTITFMTTGQEEAVTKFGSRHDTKSEITGRPGRVMVKYTDEEIYSREIPLCDDNNDVFLQKVLSIKQEEISKAEKAGYFADISLKDLFLDHEIIALEMQS